MKIIIALQWLAIAALAWMYYSSRPKLPEPETPAQRAVEPETNQKPAWEMEASFLASEISSVQAELDTLKRSRDIYLFSGAFSGIEEILRCGANEDTLHLYSKILMSSLSAHGFESSPEFWVLLTSNVRRSLSGEIVFDSTEQKRIMNQQLKLQLLAAHPFLAKRWEDGQNAPIEPPLPD